MGVGFLDTLIHLMTKDSKKQTAVILLWIQAGVWVMATTAGCLIEDGNGMDWESDGQKFAW